MRHRKRRSKLGMMTAHRNATLRNIVKALLKYQRIKTTHARAKEARRLAEGLITLSKTDSIAARRRAYSVLTDRDLVTKLFNEIAPLFKTRNSGYTRIIPLGFRRGDGASLSILELTEKKIVEKLPKKKKEKAKPEGSETKTGAPVVGEDTKEAKRPAAEHKKEKVAKKEEPKIKTIQKTKPTSEEEKKHEKAKSEDRKAADKRSFMKNLRGLFRKRGDR